MIPPRLLFALLLFLLPALPAKAGEGAAAPTDPALSPGHRKFVENYIAVVNSKDAEAYRTQIVHPACLTELEKIPAYYAEVIETRLARPISEPQGISVKSFTAKDPLPFEESYRYPLRPEELLVIDFQQEGRAFSTLIMVVEEGGQFREILPYPKPELLRKLQMAEPDEEVK